MLYVCNVEEGAAAEGNEYSQKVEAKAKAEGARAVVISAKVEEEIAQLPNGERKDFLDSIGLDEPGLNRMIRVGYELLGLLTFFTVGPKETHAWTVTKGSRAPQAAGVIHTDFEQGFIRSETIAYADYVAGKGEAGAREAGKFRLEGKDYVVADGDVLHFRFNNDTLAARACMAHPECTGHPGRCEVPRRVDAAPAPGWPGQSRSDGDARVMTHWRCLAQ